MRIFFFLLIFMISAASPAFAQQCGNQPVAENRDIGEAEGFCGDSIYSRQFEYREKRMELRRMIEQRRQDYIEPNLATYEQYTSDLEVLNEERTHADDLTSR